MANVFISYSRKDKAAALKLAGAFKEQSLDFWIDWEGIEPTVDWWREIEKGIEEANNFLFLLSPDSASSPVCQREIDHAVRNGKRLIPVVVRDIRAEEAPPQLRPLNWIFLRETDDLQNALGKLIAAIQTDYAWVEFHRSLQVKALAWERDHRENSLLLRGKDLQDTESELAINSSKEPQPTGLQREYVLKSRQTSDRQRRFLLSASVGAAIIMAGLAVFGFVQAKLATDRANIALARQLGAEAQTVNVTRSSKQMIAALLAIQSMKISPSSEAAYVLLNNNLAARPVSSLTHDDWVHMVAFSPDGKYVVSGSLDNTARVWEAATREEVARMTHDNDVWSVAFSPDGKYVVSGSEDGRVRVWEATTGEEVARMTHDSSEYSSVSSVAFSPECPSPPEASAERCGKYVVSGSWDGTARVWEAATGKEVARMTHDDWVYMVAFSPECPSPPEAAAERCGKYVVSASKDNSARVWEAATGEEVARMTHEAEVSSVAFSPDGKYVVSGSADHSARVWEAATGQEVARLTHDNWVYMVAFSPECPSSPEASAERCGKYVASASLDGTARVWEAATGKEVARTTYDISVSSVAFSPDGKYVVSAAADTNARVWEAASGKELARLIHDRGVTSAAFSPAGKYVVSGSLDDTARVWEVATGKEVARMSHDAGVSSAAFSPDGKYGVSGGCDERTESTFCIKGSARIWEATTGKEVARLAYDANVTSVAFSPDGKYVVSGSEDNTARVWEVATGEEVAHMDHQDWVTSVAFSPDGKYVVSGSQDDIAGVWEAATGKVVAHMTHDTDVTSVAFSPDGKYVVSGSGDNTARVWEAATGREIARMTHDTDVTSVAFSPDGKYVVSGSLDNSARVWEVATQEEVARMTHDSGVRSVAFSPECPSPPEAPAERCGKYVISGSEDGTARVWYWEPSDIIANTCALMSRNLTRAEWKQYIGDALPYQAVCPNLPIQPEVTPTLSPTPSF